MASKTSEAGFDLRRYAPAAVFLTLIGVVFIFLWQGYRNDIRKSEAQVLNKLQAIANTVSLSIDGDKHKALTQTYPEMDDISSVDQNADFHEMHLLLKETQEQNQVPTGIYTIFIDDYQSAESIEYFYFGVMGTEPFYRHVYSSPPQYLKDNYLVGGKIPKYEDENGAWLTAFAPVKDSEGNTVAAVMVDERFDNFIVGARQHLTRNLVLFGIVIIVGLVGFYFFQKSYAATSNLALARAKIVEREKLAELGQLTAGIAHEIQNPLNFINNFADMSVELAAELEEEITQLNSGVGADQKEQIGELLGDIKINVEKIHEHGERADSIVRNMLLHSRGEKGDKTKHDINALLDEYVNLAFHGMRGIDKTFKAEVHRDFTENLPTVQVSLQDMQRVFLNILNNAFQSVGERARNSKYPYNPIVKINTRLAEDMVEVVIWDNGLGIPQKNLEKVFTPFFTTKESGTGTGLGLSICYDVIVVEHHGEITVDSTEGEFAQFNIRIPKI